MIIDLETLARIEKLTVEVRVAGSLRRKEFIKVLRRRAVKKFADLMPEHPLPEDGVVYTAVPGPADAWGCLLYRCRWEAPGLQAELLGGPKDGQLIALAAPRTVIEFQVLAPDWREACAADPGGLVPKLRYVYRLSGFNLANGCHVFTAEEPARV